MSHALPFLVFALFAAVISIQRGHGVGPQRVRYRDLPRRVQLTVGPAWLLGLVGIAGASIDESFGVALLPAGMLLVIAGVSLRDLRPAGSRANPRFVSGATVAIGIAWGAIGAAELVALMS